MKQVKKIQEEIYSHIDPKDVSERRILCGNASNFQGDERDVIFLSVVDCANGAGPVAKQAFGVDDAYRKRYNVAASRARDQLWVVDSLDSANDLKPGDIRKMLIDYSLNPESVAISNAKIEQKAESPFESAVARFLTVRGYHLVQQWKVGAYRLDMVAVCGRKKVAIECDGESWHSGEDKIREDMERQTILERLGWQFIRIRGSEYYRDPNKTMERVVSELNDNGIEPEEASAVQDTGIRETELLQRVKQRAFAIIHQDDGETPELDKSVIESALDPKNDVIGTSIEKVNDLAVPEEKEQFTGIKDMDTVQSPAESEISPVSAPVVLPETAIKLVRDRRLKTARQNPAPEKMSPLKMQDYKTEQMMLFGMEDQKSEADNIIGLLEATGVEFVDKRANGGSLWIIGGYELAETVRKAKALGYIFHFKKEGGRATKNKPGWWAK
jgi:very-short-patch-repair endonuclease